MKTNKTVSCLFAMMLLYLTYGCGRGQDQQASLSELRRIFKEEIEDDRLKPVFLAAVGKAENRMNEGNSRSAAEVLNGLSHLAFITRHEISNKAAIGTIRAVHDLFENGVLQRQSVVGEIVPVPNPGYECNVNTGWCDIPNTRSDCYVVYELPDTTHIGCISVIRP